ncbi:MAG: molybdenum cofactor guanylyltransferase [Gemmatimonadota bacterium]
MTPASAVILAGGRSRRLGREKAFAEVGRRELLQRVLDAARGFDPLILVANDRPAYERALQRYGWRPAAASNAERREYRRAAETLLLIPDRRPGLGPLAGIEAGLEATFRELSWVVGCDQPFLTPELGRHLVAGLATERRGPHPPPEPPFALVPVLRGRPQPLCAAYERAAGEVAGACLDAGLRSVSDLLARLRVRELPARLLVELGDPASLLFNVNRGADLEEARRRAGRARTEGRAPP